MVERKRLELPPPAQEKPLRAARRTKPARERAVRDSDSPKLGRPSTYQARFAKIAQVLCSRGATDTELGDAFGVTSVCIQKWQSMHPEFGEAVRKGKLEVFDPKVERSMAQIAIGYAVDTEEVKVTKDGDVIRYPIRKHYPPNVTAAIFWLKNRQPNKWRDVWKIEHDGKVGLESLTAQQLLEEIRKEAAELGISVPPAVDAKTVAQTTPTTVGVAPVKAVGTKH